MTEEKDNPSVQEEGDAELTTLYVAYCDILGFSDRILTDFDNTLKTYRDFGKLVCGGETFKDVKTTMYSDAILLTATSLVRLLQAAQALLFFALAHDFMIRGAITKGRYWEQRLGNDLLVASDALVRAVKLEKSVSIPAIVIADDVEIPDAYWLARFQHGQYVTALLHFQDRNSVNPFNLMWGKSAAIRASILMGKNPQHKDKYLWFIALHDAVASGQELLIPPDVVNRFMQQGILKFRGTDEQNEPPT